MTKSGRRWKRVLLTLGEIAVIPFGFFLSFAVTMYISHYIESEILLVLLFGGWALTVVCFVLLLRKTRAWKFAYEVEGWYAEREEKRQHPSRVRWMRRLRRGLMWVPSGIATFVVFFFPVATHVVFPTAGCLEHYRVAVPLKWTILPRMYGEAHSNMSALMTSGKFGQFWFWRDTRENGLAAFESRVWENAFAVLDEKTETGANAVTNAKRRDFMLGRTPLTCWDFELRWHVYSHWEVRCATVLEKQSAHSLRLFTEGEKKWKGFMKWWVEFGKLIEARRTGRPDSWVAFDKSEGHPSGIISVQIKWKRVSHLRRSGILIMLAVRFQEVVHSS